MGIHSAYNAFGAEFTHNITLTDIFGLDDIQRIQDQFSDVSGVASIITDTEGNPVTKPYNESRILKQALSNTGSNFFNSGKAIAEINDSGTEMAGIHFSLSDTLMESGIRIMAGNLHIANWLIGQVRCRQINEAAMFQFAEKAGIDPDAFVKALSEIPEMTIPQFEKTVKMLALFVDELTRKALPNIQLKQQISENEKVDAETLECETRFRNLLQDVHSVSVQGYGPDGITNYWNKASERLYGYTAEEALGRNLLDLIIPEALKDTVREGIRHMVETGEAFPASELTLMHKDGSEVKVFSSHTIVSKPGDRLEFFCIDIDLTGLKAAETALKESKNLLESIINSIPDRIFWKDRESRFIGCNPLFATDAGKKYPSEIVGKTDYDLSWKEYADLYRADDQLVMTSGREKTFYVEPQTTPDGKKLVLRTSKMPLRGNDGEVIGVLGIYADITDQRNAEEALRESEEKYRLLLENSGIGVGVYGLDGTILFFNQKAIQNLGGKSEDYIGKSLIEVFGEEAGMLYLNRVLATAKSEASLEYEDFVSFESGDYWFLSNHSRIMNMKGEIIGVQVLAHDITERKKALETLENERLLIRTLIDNIPDSIYSKDLLCKKTLANHAEVNYLGAASEAEVLGKDDYDFYPEEMADDFRADDLRVMESGIPVLNKEEYIFDEKGRKRWLLSSKLPLRDKDNQIIGLVGIGRDITDRKIAEEAKYESEKNYKLLFDHLTAGFALHEIILDNQGDPCDYRFLQVNQAFEYMTGLRAADLIGKTALQVLPETESFWIETYGKVAIDGQPVNFQHLSQAIGKYFQVNAYSPERGKFASVFLDITDRMKAEEALRFSEEKYRLLIENSNEAIYVVQEMNIVFANKVCGQLTGFATEELIGKAIFDFVDPDEKPVLQKHHSDLINGLSGSHNSIFYLINRNGDKHWLSVNSVRIDWNGKPATLNMGTDFTEQKQINEQLKVSEEKYRAIFDNVQDVFYQTRLDGLILDISPSIRHFTQFNRDEMIGTMVSDFYADPDERNKLLEILAKNGELRDYELRIKAKNNEILHASLNARLVFDQYGQPSHIDGAIRDITGRKLADEAVLKSYELLNNLTAMVPGVVYQYRLYPDGHSCFPVSSRGMFDIYEVTPEDVRTDASVVFTRLHPGDVDRIVETITESARNQTMYHSDFRVILPEQGLRWRHCDARPQLLDDGSTLWYGIITDITESKKADEAMHKFQTAIENSNTSIIITDKDGLIEYANPFFTQITGYTKEEFIGKKTSILKSGYHNEDFYNEVWQTIKSGGTWEGEFYNKKKNGQLYWENAIISPISNGNNEISHFVAIKTDITATKKINIELMLAKDRAEESDRLKSAFLANMSHEIRTPMNGILGFTELLKTPGLSGEEQQDYVRIIKKSGERMLNIINDIVDISKIESGQMKLSVTDTNLNEVTEYISVFFSPEIEQKGLRITFRNGLPDNKATIKTDREKLYAILTNLVKNAIKFTKTGSIDFGYSRSEAFLRFYVKDTGAGIPPEHQTFIFDRFRQGSESLSRAYEGAGLGLSISKAYVELMGGEIWVESEPGAGSTFYFTIPYREEKEEKLPVRKGNGENRGDEGFRKLKVMIVEDDEISDMFLSIAIKMVSDEVLHADSGGQALQICLENPDIDLILMDIKIPEFDGHETTRRIREFNKEVIIIAQTAHGMSDDREKALAAGCDDYISKPINQFRLVEMIRDHFIERQKKR